MYDKKDVCNQVPVRRKSRGTAMVGEICMVVCVMLPVMGDYTVYLLKKGPRTQAWPDKLLLY